MNRPIPDYSDQPTVVVGIDPNEHELARSVGVSFEGWTAELPTNVCIVVRDYSRGDEPDEDGCLYEDIELS